MTKKLTLGTIIAAALAIGILGAFSSGMNIDSDDVNMATSQNDYVVSYMAFAEKPDQQIVMIDFSTSDYGSESTFDLDKVECKTSTKGGVTTVNWCKATLFQNKVTFATCFEELELCFEVFGEVLLGFLGEAEDFDKALVEFEVDQLLIDLDPILDALGYVVPEFEEKSVEIEMSVQNDGSAQTKVVVGIEYS